MTLEEIQIGELFAFIGKDSYRVYIKADLPRKGDRICVMIVLGRGAGNIFFKAGERDVERVSPLALERWIYQ